MPRATDQVHACPQCGSAVARVHRHLRDRLMSLILRIYRYRCSNPECRWEGVVSIPPPPAAPSTRRNWFSWVSVGWPARVAWMAIGALCVILPLEGGRYLVDRQRASQQAQAVVDPGPELLAPLPGENSDGAPLITAAVPTPDNPAPLERRNACLWGAPGRNPYKGSVRQVLVGANLPTEVVQKFDKMVERRLTSDRVEITNDAIWSSSGRRRFDPNVVAMGFGKTLCFNTRVNFPAGHVEVADLYETTDNSGAKYTIMVPYVCGNVAVLAERAERPEPFRSIPEPGTWGCLLAGLAAMAWVMRRRRVPNGDASTARGFFAAGKRNTTAIAALVGALALSVSVAMAASTPSPWAAPSVNTTAAEIRLLRAAAARNEVTAQYDLGIALACGYGVTRNRAEAATWLQKAAERGHARAQSVLGWMYMTGSGVRRSDAQALNWLRQAAEQGDTVAQNNLGIIYVQGRGVPVDRVEAEKWFARAAAQGAADAARNLDILRQGKGGTLRPPTGPPLHAS